MTNFRKMMYLSLTILTVVFIFFNSFQNGEQSKNISSTVLFFINDFFEKINLNLQIEGNFLRKLAHFIEFFALGLFLMFTFEAFTKKTYNIISWALFLSLLIPVIDETIQIFSNGRASQVTDVILDFFGMFCGLFYVIFWISVKNKIKKQKIFLAKRRF